MLQAVIFDLDGTLVDTIPIYKAVIKEIIEAHHGTFDEKSFYQGVHNTPTWDDWSQTMKVKNLTIEKFWNQVNQNILQHIPNFLTTKPGAERLLIDLMKHKLALGLYSTSHRLTIDKIIDQLEWTGVFLASLSGNEVTNIKPHPEGYLQVAEKLGVDPQNCLVIEDNISGLKAAKQAGMTCVINYGQAQDRPDKKQFQQADLIVNSLQELTPQILHDLPKKR